MPQLATATASQILTAPVLPRLYDPVNRSEPDVLQTVRHVDPKIAPWYLEHGPLATHD